MSNSFHIEFATFTTLKVTEIYKLSLSCFAFYKAIQWARLDSLPGWFWPPGLKFDIPYFEDKISVFIPWIINYFKQAKNQ